VLLPLPPFIVATVMIVLIPHPLPSRRSDESPESDVIVFFANCLLLARRLGCGTRC